MNDTRLTSLMGIETFLIIKRGRIVSKLVKETNLVFFTNQINIDGLVDFHLTIRSGLSDEDKITLLTKEVENWNKGREIITNL